MAGNNAAAKKDSSVRHFDRWASGYERDPVSRGLAALQQQALDALELGPADRLLDIGCGTGAAVRAASRVAERAVGVDVSPGMIARARELAAGINNVELYLGDVEALPFANDTFTALLCTTSFHHYPSPERAIAEMVRVLTAGGRVAIADMVTDRRVMRVADWLLRRFQRSHVGCHRGDELAQLLAAAGLAEPTTRSLMHGWCAIVAARTPA